MKRLLFFILLIPFIGHSQIGVIGFANTAFPPIDFSGSRQVVIAANSIGFGTGASDNAHRWTTLFCAAKGATENNLSISGQMICPNTCPKTTFQKTTIPTYNSSTHACLIIHLGINDVGNNQGGTITSTLFKTTYLDDVDYAINTKGWPARLIILVTPTWANSYSSYVGGCSGTNTLPDVTRQMDFNTKVQEVAAAKGTQFKDIYTPMKAALNSSYFIADGLHPNDSGHAWIATYLAGVIN